MVGLQAAAYRTEKGTTDGSAILFAVAFIGLTLVIVAALAALIVIGRRSSSARAVSRIGWVAVLLLIGVTGVWLTAAFALSRSVARAEVHAGPIWLAAGAVLFAVTAGSPLVRSWWVR